MFNNPDYETVASLNCWFQDNYPMGRIDVDEKYYDPKEGIILVKVQIWRDANDPFPAVSNLANGVRDLYIPNMRRFYVEDTATSAVGRAILLLKATKKTASADEMEKVAEANKVEEIKAQTRKKMAETSKEYVPVAKEDDPWTIRDAEPVTTIEQAVKNVEEIIGTQDKVIPNCKGCHNNKPMEWKSGMGKNGKPYGKFSCWTCKEVIWYKIAPDGTWIPQ